MKQVFVNVDEQGNITKEYSGENIVAEDEFDFFFYVDDETVDNLPNLKVAMQGMKPKLVLKNET